MSLVAIVRRAGPALMLLLAALPLAAAEPAHEHDARAGHADAGLALDQGRPWATDAALREGMVAMRAALEAQLPAIHDDALDAGAYAQLAARLQAALQGIFSNCRLPPAADAQLHKLLVPMHARIGEMGSAPALAERRAAALAVAGALGEYGRYFDHPGWAPPAH